MHTKGSSPRMRGTPPTVIFLPLALGLIPTYAGNTILRRGVRLMVGAHPHVCGEHASRYVSLLHLMGSSPRMRGTLSLLFKPINGNGLIPTYAGNTAP